MRVKCGNQVGELTSLPGCSQIAVSHDVFSLDKNAGRGSESNQERLNLCSNLGYDVVMCSVNSKNEKQLKILSNNDWSFAFDFLSSKTGHTVSVFYKRL